MIKVKAGALCMGMRRCGMKQISCRCNYVFAGSITQAAFTIVLMQNDFAVIKKLYKCNTFNRN